MRSEPAPGAALAVAPRSVRLVFDDTVRPAAGIRVSAPRGDALAGPVRRAGARTLVLPLRARGQGDYVVSWRAFSDDGHALAGTFAFSVGTGRAPAYASTTADASAAAVDVVGRTMLVGGVLLAVGSLLFGLAVAPTSRWLTATGAFVALVGVAVELARVPDGTRFGHALLLAAAGAVTTAAGALLRVRPLALAGGLALLLAPTLGGHALDRGVSWLQAVDDVLHLGAAAVWVGGLAALAAARDRRTLVQPFTRLAVPAVFLLALTGVFRAFGELGSVGELANTAYGRALLVKTSLLLLALAAAGATTASISAGSGALAVEVVAVILVVATVGYLTASRPGVTGAVAAAPAERAAGTPPLPPRGAFAVARQDGARLVALAIAPSSPLHMTATIVSGQGLGVNGLEVAFVVNGRRFAASPCGPGCYRAEAGRAAPRTARVEIDGRLLSFPLPRRWPPQEASALVRRSAKAYESQRSVSYRERLAAGPGSVLRSTWRVEAPDRVAYEIEGGSSGILIGARRWDRPGPRARWTPSSQSPVRQLSAGWGNRLRDAYVLRGTPRTLELAFVDETIPAWFRVVVDRRTLLPRTLGMTATAHFMREGPFSYDRARTIRPPR